MLWPGRVPPAFRLLGHRSPLTTSATRRSNWDLASSLGNLKELSGAGLRVPLRDYYAGIGKRLPGSWVPAQAMELLNGTKPAN